MGSFFSHPTGAEVLKKNQEYISEMNKIKMERWIQMHYQIKERETALQISRARELFYWLGSFYCVATVGLIGRYNSTRRFAVLGPIVPLTFLVAYYADLAYGTKVHRIIAEAEMIMQHEPELLEWPSGLPTVSEIDSARMENDDKVRLHPHQL
ncbi:plasminogen receptor (KT) [Sabethes cyaneus]|uniref:plasminogen receptor (KT) n=1 Tax=Sabethes cyaneus TaxID=53552 RepID=UPI00237ED12A|nr:plasminogen receptor (KT) [Sabethes cyaneus]